MGKGKNDGWTLVGSTNTTRIKKRIDKKRKKEIELFPTIQTLTSSVLPACVSPNNLKHEEDNSEYSSVNYSSDNTCSSSVSRGSYRYMNTRNSNNSGYGSTSQRTSPAISRRSLSLHSLERNTDNATGGSSNDKESQPHSFKNKNQRLHLEFPSISTAYHSTYSAARDIIRHRRAREEQEGADTVQTGVGGYVSDEPPSPSDTETTFHCKSILKEDPMEVKDDMDLHVPLSQPQLQLFSPNTELFYLLKDVSPTTFTSHQYTKLVESVSPSSGNEYKGKRQNETPQIYHSVPNKAKSILIAEELAEYYGYEAPMDSAESLVSSDPVTSHRRTTSEHCNERNNSNVLEVPLHFRIHFIQFLVQQITALATSGTNRSLGVDGPADGLYAPMIIENYLYRGIHGPLSEDNNPKEINVIDVKVPCNAAGVHLNQTSEERRLQLSALISSMRIVSAFLYLWGSLKNDGLLEKIKKVHRNTNHTNAEGISTNIQMAIRDVEGITRALGVHCTYVLFPGLSYDSISHSCDYGVTYTQQSYPSKIIRKSIHPHDIKYFNTKESGKASGSGIPILNLLRRVKREGNVDNATEGTTGQSKKGDMDRESSTDAAATLGTNDVLLSDLSPIQLNDLLLLNKIVVELGDIDISLVTSLVGQVVSACSKLTSFGLEYSSGGYLHHHPLDCSDGTISTCENGSEAAYLLVQEILAGPFNSYLAFICSEASMTAMLVRMNALLLLQNLNIAVPEALFNHWVALFPSGVSPTDDPAVSLATNLKMNLKKSISDEYIKKICSFLQNKNKYHKNSSYPPDIAALLEKARGIASLRSMLTGGSSTNTRTITKHPLFSPMLHDPFMRVRCVATTLVTSMIVQSQSKFLVAMEPVISSSGSAYPSGGAFTSLSGLLGHAMLSSHKAFIYALNQTFAAGTSKLNNDAGNRSVTWTNKESSSEMKKYLGLLDRPPLAFLKLVSKKALWGYYLRHFTHVVEASWYLNAPQCVEIVMSLLNSNIATTTRSLPCTEEANSDGKKIFSSMIVQCLRVGRLDCARILYRDLREHAKKHNITPPSTFVMLEERTTALFFISAVLKCRTLGLPLKRFMKQRNPAAVLMVEAILLLRGSRTMSYRILCQGPNCQPEAINETPVKNCKVWKKKSTANDQPTTTSELIWLNVAVSRTLATLASTFPWTWNRWFDIILKLVGNSVAAVNATPYECGIITAALEALKGLQLYNGYRYTGPGFYGDDSLAYLLPNSDAASADYKKTLSNKQNRTSMERKAVPLGTFNTTDIRSNQTTTILSAGGLGRSSVGPSKGSKWTNFTSLGDGKPCGSPYVSHTGSGNPPDYDDDDSSDNESVASDTIGMPPSSSSLAAKNSLLAPAPRFPPAWGRKQATDQQRKTIIQKLILPILVASPERIESGNAMEREGTTDIPMEEEAGDDSLEVCLKRIRTNKRVLLNASPEYKSSTRGDTALDSGVLLYPLEAALVGLLGHLTDISGLASPAQVINSSRRRVDGSGNCCTGPLQCHSSRIPHVEVQWILSIITNGRILRFGQCSLDEVGGEEIDDHVCVRYMALETIGAWIWGCTSSIEREATALLNNKLRQQPQGSNGGKIAQITILDQLVQQVMSALYTDCSPVVRVKAASLLSGIMENIFRLSKRRFSIKNYTTMKEGTKSAGETERKFVFSNIIGEEPESGISTTVKHRSSPTSFVQSDDCGEPSLDSTVELPLPLSLETVYQLVESAAFLLQKKQKKFLHFSDVVQCNDSTDYKEAALISRHAPPPVATKLQNEADEDLSFSPFSFLSNSFSALKEKESTLWKRVPLSPSIEVQLPLAMFSERPQQKGITDNTPLPKYRGCLSVSYGLRIIVHCTVLIPEFDLIMELKNYSTESDSEMELDEDTSLVAVVFKELLQVLKSCSFVSLPITEPPLVVHQNQYTSREFNLAIALTGILFSRFAVYMSDPSSAISLLQQLLWLIIADHPNAKMREKAVVAVGEIDKNCFPSVHDGEVIFSIINTKKYEEDKRTTEISDLEKNAVGTTFDDSLHCQGAQLSYLSHEDTPVCGHHKTRDLKSYLSTDTCATSTMADNVQHKTDSSFIIDPNQLEADKGPCDRAAASSCSLSTLQPSEISTSYHSLVQLLCEGLIFYLDAISDVPHHSLKRGNQSEVFIKAIKGVLGPFITNAPGTREMQEVLWKYQHLLDKEGLLR